MSNFSKAGSSLKAGNVMMLSEIQIPESFYKRYKTLSDVLDRIFGGDDLPGVMPGSSILFTGTPGSGKSTTLLQLVDFFSMNGISVLYNVGEENEYSVKYRAQRLGVKGLFTLGKFEETGKLVEYCIENKVDILVQDSLQSLSDEDEDGARLLKSSTEKLVTLSKEFGVTTFIVGHVTKGGVMAGPQKIAHDVDVHAHLSINKDTGGRIFQIMKNRFGPAGIPYEFAMSADGMQFKELSAEPEQTKAQVRKDKAEETIEKLLLAGRKLSGYSMDEEPELRELNISGGMMRVLLGRVSKKLESEGHIVMRETISRREHLYVEV